MTLDLDMIISPGRAWAESDGDLGGMCWPGPTKLHVYRGVNLVYFTSKFTLSVCIVYEYFNFKWVTAEFCFCIYSGLILGSKLTNFWSHFKEIAQIFLKSPWVDSGGGQCFFLWVIWIRVLQHRFNTIYNSIIAWVTRILLVIVVDGIWKGNRVRQLRSTLIFSRLRCGKGPRWPLMVTFARAQVLTVGAHRSYFKIV